MDKVLTVSVAAYNVEKTIGETLDHFTKVVNKNLIEVLAMVLMKKIVQMRDCL